MAKVITSEYIMEIAAPMLDSMSGDEFFTFCQQNKLVQIERDENREIVIMPLDGLTTAILKSKIIFALGYWNNDKQAGKGFGPSAGFSLPDSSVKSPDAGWISNEKWNSLEKEDLKKFAHVAPEFIVELMSPSDNQKDAKAKMQKWIENGVLLGWLIDPAKKEAYIYRADGTIGKIEGFENKLSGENVLPGFEFDLSVLV